MAEDTAVLHLLEQARVGFLAFDLDWRVVYVNHRGQELLGRSRDELVGRTIWSEFPDEALLQFRSEAERSLRSGRPVRFAEYAPALGSWLDVQVYPSGRGISAFFAESSARPGTEAGLREKRDRLRALVDAIPVAVVALDGEGRVVHTNVAAERMFGWSRDEVTGRLHPLIAEHEVATFRTFMDELLESDEPHRFLELERTTKAGDVLELGIWAAPVRGDAGPVHFIAVAVDMTERHALERELAHAQKLDALGRVAGGVAHDFNNILTVITGHVQMLLADLEPTAPEREDVQGIGHAAERATALTRQLLTFSKQQIVQPRVLDLNQTISQFTAFLRRLIGEHVEIDLELGEYAGNVKADPANIDQVLMNLVINARDAMPEGGRVVIRTARRTLADSDTQPELGLEPGAYTTLRVEDAGLGMSREVRDQIFDPFFTTKGPGGGTGLGLSTVYGIVQQAGGAIRVESEPGKGSTFEVWLPRVQEPTSEPVAEPGPGKDVPTGNGEVILLVEDDLAVRRMLRKLLVRGGYDLLEAPTALEAVALATDFPGEIRLIISDVALPGMRGTELAECFALSHPDVPILFITGHASLPGEQHEALRRLGDVLAKPFATEQLLARVRTAMDRRRPTRTEPDEPGVPDDRENRPGRPGLRRRPAPAKRPPSRRRTRTAVRGGLLVVAMLAFLGAALLSVATPTRLLLILLGLALYRLSESDIIQRLLPESRRYLALRSEVNSFLSLMRELNRSAVRMRNAEDGASREDIYLLRNRMHSSVDRMVVMAGRPADETDPAGSQRVEGIASLVRS